LAGLARRRRHSPRAPGIPRGCVTVPPQQRRPICAVRWRSESYRSRFRSLNPQPRAIMTNLTKREIVLEIYRKSGFPQKQIVDTVQQTLDIIQKALANGRNVELRNFGVLEVQVRKQRIGRNPNKPE